MIIKIQPVHIEHELLFSIYLDDWSTGATYRTYDGACAVANAISDHAVTDGVVTIQYGDAAEAARKAETETLEVEILGQKVTARRAADHLHTLAERMRKRKETE